MKIVACTKVRNESDIIESLCRYYLSFCDEMVVFDNISMDNTQDILNKLAEENKRLTVIPIDKTPTNMAAFGTIMMDYAFNEMGADLVIPADADEFLFCEDGGNPRDMLEQLRPDVEYRIARRNYVVLDKVDENTFLPHQMPSYNSGKFQPTDKVLFSRYLRENRGGTHMNGFHGLRYEGSAGESPVQVQRLKGLIYGHYPIRNEKQVLLKVLLGWLYIMLYPDRGTNSWHWKEMYEAIRESGQVSAETVSYISCTYSLTKEQAAHPVVTEYGPLNAAFISPKKLELRYTHSVSNENQAMKIIMSQLEELVDGAASWRKKADTYDQMIGSSDEEKVKLVAQQRASEAGSYVFDGHYEEAAALFDAIGNIDHLKPESCYLYAMTLSNLQTRAADWPKAEQLFNAALAGGYNPYSVYFQRGSHYLRMGQPRQAIADFCRCREIDGIAAQSLSALISELGQQALDVSITQIPIKNLVKTVRVMQITDTHLLRYTAGDDAEKNAFMQKRKEVMGVSSEPPYEEMLAAGLKYASEHDVDLVLLTGDILDFPSDENIQICAQLIQETPVETVFMFGNHDYIFRYNDLKEQRAEYASKFERLKIKDCEDKEINGLRFLFFDNSVKQFSEEQLSFLEEKAAEGKPCVAAFHVPMYLPGDLNKAVLELWHAPQMFGAPDDVYDSHGWSRATETTKKAMRLFQHESSPFVHIIAGHTHLSRDDKVRPNLTQSLCADSRFGKMRIYEYVPL